MGMAASQASPSPASRRGFEALLAPLLGSAYGLARTLTHNAAEADDLLQEAALQAFCGFHSFTQGTNFKAWFYRILTNRHYYRHRQTKRRPATVELEDSPDLYLYARTAEVGLHAASEDPAALLMSKMTRKQVLAAVTELPEDFRLVVTLYLLEDTPYAEIAEVAGCPMGTVRSRLHRGRKMLQKKLWRVAQEAGVVGDPTVREERT